MMHKPLRPFIIVNEADMKLLGNLYLWVAEHRTKPILEPFCLRSEHSFIEMWNHRKLIKSKAVLVLSYSYEPAINLSISYIIWHVDCGYVVFWKVRGSLCPFMLPISKPKQTAIYL